MSSSPLETRCVYDLLFAPAFWQPPVSLSALISVKTRERHARPCEKACPDSTMYARSCTRTGDHSALRTIALMPHQLTKVQMNSNVTFVRIFQHSAVSPTLTNAAHHGVYSCHFRSSSKSKLGQERTVFGYYGQSRGNRAKL